MLLCGRHTTARREARVADAQASKHTDLRRRAFFSLGCRRRTLSLARAAYEKAESFAVRAGKERAAAQRRRFLAMQQMKASSMRRPPAGVGPSTGVVSERWSECHLLSKERLSLETKAAALKREASTAAADQADLAMIDRNVAIEMVTVGEEEAHTANQLALSSKEQAVTAHSSEAATSAAAAAVMGDVAMVAGEEGVEELMEEVAATQVRHDHFATLPLVAHSSPISRTPIALTRNLGCGTISNTYLYLGQIADLPPISHNRRNLRRSSVRAVSFWLSPVGHWMSTRPP